MQEPSIPQQTLHLWNGLERTSSIHFPPCSQFTELRLKSVGTSNYLQGVLGEPGVHFA